MKRCSAFSLFILSMIAIIAFLVRQHGFYNLEPHIDQAFYSGWTYLLVKSNHFLPSHSHISFSQALMQDNGSLLNQFLRKIYVDPVLIFISVAVFCFYIAAILFSPAYPVFVATSIVFSILTILLFGLYPYFILKTKRKCSDFILGLLTAGLIATSFYLQLFSPWGAHNIGVFFLFLSLFYTQRIILKLQDSAAKISLSEKTIFISLQVIALFSSWANAFLLPPATVIGLLINRSKSSFKISLLYAVLVFLLLAITPMCDHIIHHSTTALRYTNILNLSLLWPNTKLFFTLSISLFSLPGFIFGIMGLGLLGYKKREWLPLLTLFFFYLFPYALLNFTVVTNVSYRLFIYALPLFAFGLAYFIIWAWKKVKTPVLQFLTIGMILIIMMWHLSVQWPLLLSPLETEKYLPEFYNMYLSFQGRLTPIIQDIISQLPNHATVLPWDEYTENITRTLAVQQFQEKHIDMPLKLSPIVSKKQNNSLKKYLEQTLPVFPKNKTFYIITNDSASMNQLNQSLQALFKTYYHSRVILQTRLIKNYPVSSHYTKGTLKKERLPNSYALYQVLVITNTDRN